MGRVILIMLGASIGFSCVCGWLFLLLSRCCHGLAEVTRVLSWYGCKYLLARTFEERKGCPRTILLARCFVSSSWCGVALLWLLLLVAVAVSKKVRVKAFLNSSQQHSSKHQRKSPLLDVVIRGSSLANSSIKIHITEP